MKLIRYKCLKDKKILESFILLERNEDLDRYFSDERIRKVKAYKGKQILRISKKNQYNIFYSLEKLLKAGLTLPKIVELQENGLKSKILKGIYNHIKWKLNQGEDIFEILLNLNILKKDELMIAYSNQEKGSIYESFLCIKDRREKIDKKRKDNILVLIYPLIVLLISLLLIIIISIFIVPKFEDIYISSDKELPNLTKIVLNISKFLREKIILIIGLFFISYYMLMIINKKYFLLYKIKIIKKYYLEKNLIEIIENLSSMLLGGVTLEKSIQLVLRNISNRYFQEEFKSFLDIKNGKTLSKIMKENNYLTDLEINMLVIGEESATIGKMLKEIHILKMERKERYTKIYLKSIEPFSILVIGILVSIFVIALYLPILNITEIII